MHNSRYQSEYLHCLRVSQFHGTIGPSRLCRHILVVFLVSTFTQCSSSNEVKYPAEYSTSSEWGWGRSCFNHWHHVCHLGFVQSAKSQFRNPNPCSQLVSRCCQPSQKRVLKSSKSRERIRDLVLYLLGPLFAGLNCWLICSSLPWKPSASGRMRCGSTVSIGCSVRMKGSEHEPRDDCGQGGDH